MTIIGKHRGPISGITHVHLLRESPEIRKARSGAADQAPGKAERPAEAVERAASGGDAKVRVSPAVAD
jgi:hypothetical protein